MAQILKNVTKASEYVTLGIVLALSFLAAVVYVVLTHYNLWESFASVLTIAGAVYTYIIARFETSAANGTNGVLNVSTPASANAPG